MANNFLFQYTSIKKNLHKVISRQTVKSPLVAQASIIASHKKKQIQYVKKRKTK